MQDLHDHKDIVTQIVHSGSAAARSRLAASWRRSLVLHKLDPGASCSADAEEFRELSQRKEQLAGFLRLAAPNLDRLFELVGLSGCGVVLTDAQGVILDHRYSRADTCAFETWGLREGTNWSEASEGTNGIGTCIAEMRKVIIHKNEHFMSKNTGMSCIDAPIFGADGQLIAALDVSSARADQTEAINGLISAMVVETARKIELENFRSNYTNDRIIVADYEGSDGAVLFAVNTDDIVVGATRGARKAFGMTLSGAFNPMPASDLFGNRDGPTGFERAERAAVMRALTRAKGNVSEAARALGISRATLYRRIKRLGLSEL